MMARTDATKVADVPAAMEAYINELKDPDLSPKIKTGFSDLDRALNGGLAEANLVMLGARRKTGKTAVGTQIASHAMYQGKRIVWISQEMTAQQVVGRLLGVRSHVRTAERDENDPMPPAEIQTIENARAEYMQEQLLTIYDRPITAERLYAMARTWKATGKLDLLVVDQLQRLQRDIKRGSTEAASLWDDCKTLKQVAMDLEIPVLCLASTKQSPGRAHGLRACQLPLHGRPQPYHIPRRTSLAAARLSVPTQPSRN